MSQLANIGQRHCSQGVLKNSVSLVSWLNDVFRRKGLTAADSSEGDRQSVTFEDRPGWATATGLYRTVGSQSVGEREPWQVPSLVIAAPDSDATPLPRRYVLASLGEPEPMWTTRYGGDAVGIGDLVALDLLSHRDATGRIVGAAEGGRVVCTLSDRHDPYGVGPRVRVDADQILMLLSGPNRGNR